MAKGNMDNVVESPLKQNPSAVYSVNPFREHKINRSNSPPVPAAIAYAAVTSGSGTRATSRSRPRPETSSQNTDPMSQQTKKPSSELVRRDTVTLGSAKTRALSVPRVRIPTTHTHDLRSNYNRNRIAVAQAMVEASQVDPEVKSPYLTSRAGSTSKLSQIAKSSSSTFSTLKTPSRTISKVTKDFVSHSANLPIRSPATSATIRPIARPLTHTSSKSNSDLVQRYTEAEVLKSCQQSGKGKITSQIVTSQKDSNMNIRLNLNLACPFPSTPVTGRTLDYDAEVYRKFKIPDPTLSPEDRAREFLRTSISPRIKADLTEQKMSIIVAVRLRPFSPSEIKSANTKLDPVVQLDKSTNCVHITGHPNVYEFNCILDSFNPTNPVDNQESVYQSTGKPLVDHALQGYNSCLFAYGQTGSGKTYSLTGDDLNPGVIPRLVSDLFISMSNDTRISMTYIEIYNDTINNLLADSTTQLQNITYKIREHTVEGPYIPNLLPIVVENPDDLISRWTMGNLRRQTAATLSNEHSSRSHAILQITVQQKYLDDSYDTLDNDASSQASDGERLISKINLVDLAGSERAYTAHTCGDRLKEGSYINKSLFTLGKVINELSSSENGVKSHIPYRESPLTFLLKESLGGNSRTIMLATISPALANLEETLSTLRYASKAQRIVNRVRINEDPKLSKIRILEQEIQTLLRLLSRHKIDPNVAFEVEPGDTSAEISMNDSSTATITQSTPKKELKKETKVKVIDEDSSPKVEKKSNDEKGKNSKREQKDKQEKNPEDDQQTEKKEESKQKNKSTTGGNNDQSKGGQENGKKGKGKQQQQKNEKKQAEQDTEKETKKSSDVKTTAAASSSAQNDSFDNWGDEPTKDEKKENKKETQDKKNKGQNNGNEKGQKGRANQQNETDTNKESKQTSKSEASTSKKSSKKENGEVTNENSGGWSSNEDKNDSSKPVGDLKDLGMYESKLISNIHEIFGPSINNKKFDNYELRQAPEVPERKSKLQNGAAKDAKQKDKTNKQQTSVKSVDSWSNPSGENNGKNSPASSNGWGSPPKTEEKKTTDDVKGNKVGDSAKKDLNKKFSEVDNKKSSSKNSAQSKEKGPKNQTNETEATAGGSSGWSTPSPKNRKADGGNGKSNSPDSWGAQSNANEKSPKNGTPKNNKGSKKDETSSGWSPQSVKSDNQEQSNSHYYSTTEVRDEPVESNWGWGEPEKESKNNKGEKNKAKEQEDDGGW